MIVNEKLNFTDPESRSKYFQLLLETLTKVCAILNEGCKGNI